jgi:hypothetical protein
VKRVERRGWKRRDTLSALLESRRDAERWFKWFECCPDDSGETEVLSKRENVEEKKAEEKARRNDERSGGLVTTPRLLRGADCVGCCLNRCRKKE